MTCRSLLERVTAMIVAASLTVACQIASADSTATIELIPIHAGTFRSPLLKRDLEFHVFAPNEPAGQRMPMGSNSRWSVRPSLHASIAENYGKQRLKSPLQNT